MLAEARARGFALNEYAFRLERDLPVLRFRLGPRLLWGCRAGLPGEPGLHVYAPDVVIAHNLAGIRQHREIYGLSLECKSSFSSGLLFQSVTRG